jgi:hypothetical protein
MKLGKKKKTIILPKPVRIVLPTPKEQPQPVKIPERVEYIG